MNLALSDKISLQPEAVTRTFGILGMRGSGKSNLAVVLAEQMFHAGLHWIAIDPKGDWTGVRSSRDGMKPGLPVPIFGGRHGDIPLEPSAGAYIADLIVEQTLTCILDLSEFSEGDKIRFMAGVGREEGFAARLYRRKAPEQPPTHIFFEEADDVLPQKVMRDRAKLLHDCSRLLLWGRQRGIGGTIITQRSARIHKDVLTQCENLLVFRVVSPQDTAAIKEWVKYHGQSEEVIESLHSLRDGEGWLWSPEWLRRMERAQFHRRQTFDSGATPVAGKQAGKPRSLADVDIPKVRERMRDTIERAKAEDPRELNRKISALQAELRKKPSAASPTVDKSAIDRAVEKAVATESKRAAAIMSKVQARVAQVLASVTTLDEILKAIPATQPALASESSSTTHHVDAARRLQSQGWNHGTVREIGKREVASNGTLAAAEQRFLTVLAQRQDRTTDRNRLAILAGYSSSSRHVDNVIAALRSQGWVEGSRAALGITGSGLQALGAWNPLPTGTDLAQHWYSKLGAAPRQFLMKLVETFPNTMTRDEVASATGYSVDSRHVDNVIAELRSKDLISGTRAALLANEELAS